MSWHTFTCKSRVNVVVCRENVAFCHVNVAWCRVHMWNLHVPWAVCMCVNGCVCFRLNKAPHVITTTSHVVPQQWQGTTTCQVSFAKEPYKRDDILQKRPMILRSLLIVATPCEFPQQHHNTWRVVPYSLNRVVNEILCTRPQNLACALGSYVSDITIHTSHRNSPHLLFARNSSRPA